MAAGTKQSYAELLASKKKLELRLAEVQRAMKEADRSLVWYGVSQWVAIPLPKVQHDAIRDQLRESRNGHVGQHGGGTCLKRDESGMEHWEAVVEDDAATLPGYRHYVVRYLFNQDEGCHAEKVWALVPF